MESARSIAAGATNCSIELSTGGAVLAFRGRMLRSSAPADSASSSETLSARLLILSQPTPADDSGIRFIAASMTCRTAAHVERQQIEKVPARTLAGTNTGAAACFAIILYSLSPTELPRANSCRLRHRLSMRPGNPDGPDAQH